jgi:glycosyltransferase involved in cell wall biosynthesis
MKTSMIKKPTVAFVVQRFGTEVAGGAETLCRMIVKKMSPLWDIEVLTSCAREYIKRFENDYAPGIEDLNGFVVKRFKIDYLRSNDAVFSKLDLKVLKRAASRDEEMLWLKEIGPYSSDLIRYVEQHIQKYDLFFFFTYLYSTTTLILPLVKERSILVPAAHDEPPIFARFFDDFFALPRALICSTNEEFEFVSNRSRRPLRGAHIAGAGMDAPALLNPAYFREKYDIKGDFLLYVGRIQKEKGCDQLFEYYLSLPARIRKKYSLVMLGKRAMSVPQNDNIITPGFVSEELKHSAMAAAKLTVMPSTFESLNMVTLESWLCGTPVLVNGSCEVLKAQCRRSNGGLWYDNFAEFEACLTFLLNDDVTSATMARNGKSYVEKNYSWEKIISVYTRAFNDVCCPEKNVLDKDSQAE